MRLPLLAVLVYCTGCAPEARPATVAVPSGSEAADSSFSDAEKESIRQQVRENWIVDVGMDGLETMAAQIDVDINPDGAVQSANIDPAGDNGNPNGVNLPRRACVPFSRAARSACPQISHTPHGSILR
jgi:hypothetical protein